MTHFEEELKHLKQEVNIMFVLVRTQIAKANDGIKTNQNLFDS